MSWAQIASSASGTKPAATSAPVQPPAAMHPSAMHYEQAAMTRPEAAPVSATPAHAPQPQQTTQSTNPQGRGLHSLYFGDLAPEVTGSLLSGILREVGEIDTIRVCRDRVTRQSLGYAYVNFHKKEDADLCLERLNFMPIAGKPVRITRQIRDQTKLKNHKGNVFIKGLCKSIDNRILLSTFQQYGPILSCKVRENLSGNSNIAFVNFEDEASARKVIEEVNGKFVDGKKVTVEMFVPRSARDAPDLEQTYVNLYVKPLAKSLTEEQFRTYFERFGTISSCKLTLNEDGTSRGFGFVAYKDHDSAKAAVEAVKGVNIPELCEDDKAVLYAGRMQSKAERDRIKEANYKKYLQERSKYLNLYIKNIDPEVDEARLQEEFGKFGEIHSVSVQRDENGASKCFGFVCFRNQADAREALDKLALRDGVLGKKPLYINIAQSREQRDQQQQYAPMQTQSTAGHYGMMMNYPHTMMGGRGGGFMQGGMPQPNIPYGSVPNMMQMYPQNFGYAAGGGRGGYPGYMGGAAPGRGGAMQYGGGRGGPPAAARGGFLGAAMGYPSQQREEANGGGMATMYTLLRGMEETERRQKVGEGLFPKIQALMGPSVKADDPRIGKVTGMLIDLELEEVCKLMDEGDALAVRVTEALQLLEQQGQGETA